MHDYLCLHELYFLYFFLFVCYKASCLDARLSAKRANVILEEPFCRALLAYCVPARQDHRIHLVCVAAAAQVICFRHIESPHDRFHRQIAQSAILRRLIERIQALLAVNRMPAREEMQPLRDFPALEALSRNERILFVWVPNVLHICGQFVFAEVLDKRAAHGKVPFRFDLEKVACDFPRVLRIVEHVYNRRTRILTLGLFETRNEAFEIPLLDAISNIRNN